jgi:hypothetical protein
MQQQLPSLQHVAKAKDYLLCDYGQQTLFVNHGLHVHVALSRDGTDKVGPH